MKKHWWLVLLALGLVVGAVITHFGWQRTIVKSPPPKTSDVPPGEYLYLDSSRVATYLSQLEDGLSASEVRTLSHTTSLSAGTGPGSPIQVTGTAQTQSSLQETVTPTEASLFFRLDEKLGEQGWLTKLDAAPSAFPKLRNRIENLDEGSFVRVKNCRLILPAFAQIYPAFRNRAPALPLSLDVHGSAGGRIDLLFPIAYSKLANEPSLFGTRLSVLGMVIRRVDTGEPSYVDTGSKATFFRLLAKHQAKLAALHFSPALFEQQFTAAVTVHGPGLVVLPVAIFK